MEIPKDELAKRVSMQTHLLEVTRDIAQARSPSKHMLLFDADQTAATMDPAIPRRQGR